MLTVCSAQHYKHEVMMTSKTMTENEVKVTICYNIPNGHYSNLCLMSANTLLFIYDTR